MDKELIKKLKRVRKDWKYCSITILLDALEHCEGESKEEIGKYLIYKYGDGARG